MKPVVLHRHGRHLPFTPWALIPILLAGCQAWGQTTELQPGSMVTGALNQRETARYTIDADANDFILGEVDQISVDVDIRILDPDGEQIGQFGGLGQGIERFAGRTSSAGTHTVEVSVAEDFTGISGRYAVTLLRHEPVATDPEKLADQMMARFDGPESPGAAVRVWRDGETLYSNTYGMANLTYGIPFAEDTRTNIGSTSKQFTAFAVMLQAERGHLSLDDDIRTHIPELPEFDGTIQVRHLVTHTSGLREFLNLLRMTGRRLDRGDWIDRSELIDIAQRQPALQNAPGAEWNYNNTAFGLAATIVERTSGQTFHDFMEENVFGPLGMTGSMVRPSNRHIVPNQSEGYTPAGDGYRQIGDLGGAVGAGAVYSTIVDLQTWAENYASPRVGTRETIDEMMTSFVLTDGEETGYGYGLFIDEQGGLTRVHHGGADVAHRSMLAYYPEINAGITTQSNHAQFNSNTAFELAEAFFREDMELEEEEETVADDDDPEDSDPEDLDAQEEWKPGAEDLVDFTGRFFSEEIETYYTFTVEEGDLVMHQRRLDVVTLTPGETDGFSGGGMTFAFERDRNGQVIGFYLSNGRTRDVRFGRVR